MYVSSSLCRRETILFPTLVSILTVSCTTSQNKTSDHYHHVIVCAKSFEVEWSFPVSREHLHLGSMSEQLPPKYVSLERFDTILWETRSSWLNCALRDNEAVYLVSRGHYEAVIDDTGSVKGIYAFIYWAKQRSGQVLTTPYSLTDRLWKTGQLSSL